MKVKDIGKAIGEFELNNIPKLISYIFKIITLLTLRLMYFLTNLIKKYWYIYFAVFTWLFTRSSKLMVWDKDHSSYNNIGPISISEEGFYTIGMVIGGYIVAHKIANKLAPIFKH
ncbi:MULTISPECIES: hypothetical protein [Shewanella]|uniref:hypothetical protein n=1 Tax=Shewanella TaxID=22 RepID=UPI0011842619|nr:hypothetical protein [Shewanella algae]TVL04676.1 hypothetical protein AYI84_05945 [Shewanella algae]TVL55144.1 hypothetical protein AYI99_03655 [Shewanella algae]